MTPHPDDKYVPHCVVGVCLVLLVALLWVNYA
jgi:hypothetical protein